MKMATLTRQDLNFGQGAIFDNLIRAVDSTLFSFQLFLVFYYLCKLCICGGGGGVLKHVDV